MEEEKKSYREIILTEVKKIQKKCQDLPEEEQRYWRKVVNSLLFDLHEFERQERTTSLVDVESEDFFDRVWKLIIREFFGE